PFSFSTTPATPVFSPLSLHDALPIFYFSSVETQQTATIQAKPHPAIRIFHHSHHAVQVRVAGGRKRCDLAAFKFGEAAISSGPDRAVPALEKRINNVVVQSVGRSEMFGFAAIVAVDPVF